MWIHSDSLLHFNICTKWIFFVLVTLTMECRGNQADEIAQILTLEQDDNSTLLQPDATDLELGNGTMVQKNSTLEQDNSTHVQAKVAPGTESVRQKPYEIFPGVKRAELTTPMAWMEEAILMHNDLRKLHGSGELAFNKTLCQISQAWANYLAEMGIEKHNPQKGEIGENLYYSKIPLLEDMNATIPVKAWYDELSFYNFETTQSRVKNQAVEHFTQVVWKGSKEIGIAFARNAKPRNGLYTTYVIANYYPRGNYDDFHVNVLRLLKPSDSKSSSTSFSFLLLGCSISFICIFFCVPI